MKTIITHCILCCALALTLLHQTAFAQTITINSVSATSFCAGDPISVNFSAAGTWGHKNAFTLQLSDPSGSFSSGFKNIGSIFDTVGGTFNVVSSIPTDAKISSSYRIRILGAAPYTPSPDNGSDLSIENLTQLSIMQPPRGAYHPARAVGIPFQISASVADSLGHPIDGIYLTNDSIFWDFGPAVTPSTLSGRGSDNAVLSPTITYTLGGLQTINLRVTNGSCSNTISSTMPIYDCTPPVIPHSAIVLDHDTVFDDFHHVSLWVNPGVHVVTSAVNIDTIFAESGSTISGMLTSTRDVHIFLKAGASVRDLIHAEASILIYEEGADFPPLEPSLWLALKCPSLEFNYTQAPPNIVFNGAVVDEGLVRPMNVLPNPTTGLITVTEAPLTMIGLEILNVLGQTVVTPSLPHSKTFPLDLSTLQPGTYYLRVVSKNGVSTQKIIKQ